MKQIKVIKIHLPIGKKTPFDIENFFSFQLAGDWRASKWQKVFQIKNSKI